MQSKIEVLKVYTDGACSGNPGPGGWGVVLIFNDQQKEISGYSANTTNNAMELTATIEAFKFLKQSCYVDLFTDSIYVQQGITNWIHTWQKNGWITASKKPVKNLNLWLELLDTSAKHQVNWHWVKGHSSDYFNNLADKLARDAIKRNNV